jgi:hypothetical protein
MSKDFGNGFDGNPKRYFGQISRGYSQKPLVTSTTQHAPLGAVLDYQDGTQFRYALAAAAIDTANLCAGDVLTASAAGPGLVKTDTDLTAAAVGATEVIITDAAVASTAANVFAGAKLMIEDHAGEGHAYPIIASTAGSPTTLTIHPDFPLAVAVTTATDVQIIQHPCFEVITATAFAGTDVNVVGVTPVAVADNEYFWMQTKGLASVQVDVTTAQGAQGNMVLSDGTAGNAQLMVESTIETIIGRLFGASVGGAHAAIWLNLGW